jgi:hypothetical protein
MHPAAAALTAQQLAQQILVRWWAGLLDTSAERPDLLHAVEQLFGDKRFVQPFDVAALVT